MKLKAKAYLRIAAEDWSNKYDAVGDFYEGLAAVELDGKWGFVDNNGNVVVPLMYDGVSSFSEGFAKVKLNGKWGLVDKMGKEVIPLKYDDVWPLPFSEGLAKVWLNTEIGLGTQRLQLLIDKQGREIPKDYLTAVMLGGSLDRILEIEGSK